ncbi:MAG: CoA transferase [Alphaproteobacteria bacterium]|nr:CoA transferase [Alphaproteobacteria bacterium]MDE2012369.1 CoA transferase [Alphaproteobacteria bacterium]
MTTHKSGPFSGLLVIDMTRVLAGPYCALLMAELGARVIKVEPPRKGDDSRAIGPFVPTPSGGTKSGYFMSINRGKESIALDLKVQSERTIFEALLARADVLIENYRGGTMEKLGYGYETLSEKYPRLIYAAVTGFGHTGPYAKRPAYDVVAQAMGGIMSLTGHPGSPPTRVGSSMGDLTAGLFAATGIATALYDREKTGRGQKVDVAMMDSQVAILENAIARYVATGEVPGPLGSRHPSIAPFAAFATADKHIVIAAGNDALFAKTARVLGREDLIEDGRFRTNPLRVQHVDELAAELETALLRRPAAEWLALLEAEGVPSAPINNVADVMADPQVAARNMIVTAMDPEIGPWRMQGNPIKLSAHDDPATRAPAPDLDADRAAILKELGL